MGKWLPFTFAPTGRRNGEYGTQGVALGYELAGLSARTEPQIGLLVKRRQRPFQGQRRHPRHIIWSKIVQHFSKF